MKPFGKIQKLIIKLTPERIQKKESYWTIMRFFQYKRHYLHHAKKGFLDAYYELPMHEYKPSEDK